MMIPDNNPSDKELDEPDFQYFLTNLTRIQIIPPDVFIVADFRFFHGSMPVHFVDDYSESQEINLTGERGKQTQQTH